MGDMCMRTVYKTVMSQAFSLAGAEIGTNVNNENARYGKVLCDVTVLRGGISGSFANGNENKQNFVQKNR